MAKFWWETPLGQSRIDEINATPKQQRQGSGLRTRNYAGARTTRLTADWRVTNGSADSELVSSLTTLRSRSRQLVRDASFAKRARVIVVNNVIGCGIGLQAQVMTTREDLNTRVNDNIEEVWDEWSQAQNCHTGGRLAFKHFERAVMGQVFDAGECFVRKHYRKFGNSAIPYALELIEAERMADELASPVLEARTGNEVRMGIEVDSFFRPVAYFIRRRHPSELRFRAGAVDEIVRVPADQIIHLAVVDRWPQTRGEPWMHSAARRLNDMDGYSEAEIVRARSQANNGGGIETPEDVQALAEEMADGSFEMESEPGVWKRLNPGEKLILPSPTAPNPAYDDFIRAMLREVAAGSGPSYESLSRDYSQSNYSSSRLALLDDRDLWKFFQSWFICDFRYIVHKEWLSQAVLAGAIESIPIEQYAVNTKKFEAVRFKPRGWSWIDPTKEVEAYSMAIKDGSMTLTDVIAMTNGGQDIEDVLATRERELKLIKEKGLVFETSPEFYMADVEKAKAQAKAAANPKPPPKDDEETTQKPGPGRVFHIGGKRDE